MVTRLDQKAAGVGQMAERKRQIEGVGAGGERPRVRATPTAGRRRRRRNAPASRRRRATAPVRGPLPWPTNDGAHAPRPPRRWPRVVRGRRRGRCRASATYCLRHGGRAPAGSCRPGGRSDRSPPPVSPSPAMVAAALEVERAHEDTEPPECGALGVVEELVTPVDDGAQRPMTISCRTRSGSTGAGDRRAPRAVRRGPASCFWLQPTRSPGACRRVAGRSPPPWPGRHRLDRRDR